MVTASKMLGKVLVPLDGSVRAERALPYALGLAKASYGQILLLRGTTALHPDKETVGDLEGVAARLRRSGVAAETQLYHIYAYEDAARAILNTALLRGAGLIVLSTHGRSGLGRWLYGSVADRLLRETDIPMIIVSPSCDQPWPTARPPRILVPLNSSPDSAAVLDAVTKLQVEMGVRLLLARIVVPSADEEVADAHPGFDPAAEIDTARRELTAVAAELTTSDQDPEIHVRLGLPEQMIAAVAREHSVDLIAMVTQGQARTGPEALSRVTTATLRQSTVPFFLVRPPIAQAPSKEATPMRSVAVLAPAEEPVTISLSRAEAVVLRRVLAALFAALESGPEPGDNVRHVLAKLEQAFATSPAERSQ